MSGTSFHPPVESAGQPRFSPAAMEDLLLGCQRLRRAFLQAPPRFAGRNAPLLEAGASEPAAILIRNGFAYHACVMAEGRRAMLRVLLPGDFVGLDSTVLARAKDDIFAANRVSYHLLGAAALRGLFADPAVVTFAMAQLAEQRWQSDRLAASIGRRDAYTRLCVLLLDIHDRLRHRGLINRPTFNLPLTQEQLANHLGLTLVHVNRTLRRLREEKIVLVDRQVVIIQDMGRLRAMAQGLPEAVEIPDSLASQDWAVFGEARN